MCVFQWVVSEEHKLIKTIYTVYTLPALAKVSFSEFVQMIDVSMAKDGKIHPQLERFQESGIRRIGW